MSAIIAGRFDSFSTAETAASRLRAQGFADQDLNLFYVNPPGQHAAYAIGGDHAADAGARKSGVGAISGVLIGAAVGAAVGAALVAALGETPPMSILVLVFAIGLGAYLGSLAGALALARNAGRNPRTGQPPVRNAGVVLAAHLTSTDTATADTVATVLRQGGARDVERAEGQWVDGRWADFDPLVPPVPADTRQRS
ncbi:DUF6861 domain-containing protein [Cupriavidus taiwanensis]|uniref:Glycine zipper domain-containing protein n=1 Tax=Cupriavidus taiwanensis TaxID=164546 RepID=A0A375CDB2_9BURK|nr:conserved Hypothetical protein, putative membrane protein [Cupriavidus taiwanensis]